MQRTGCSFGAVILVAATMVWGGNVTANNLSTTSKNFTVSYDFGFLQKKYKGKISDAAFRMKIDEMKAHAARVVPLVTEDAEQALKDVTSFLNIRYAGKIKILISAKYRFPRTSAANATMRLPSNRLRLRGASKGPKFLRGRGATIWNGVTNVVAVTGHPKKKWGRFLKEGISDFTQEKFGGKIARPWPSKFYPTMGQDIHRSTAKQMAAFDGPFSLEGTCKKKLPDCKDIGARKGVHLRRLDRTRRLAYTMAGSFVRYLIENRGGVARFMIWYKGEAFEKAYGNKLGTVEADWKKFIGS